jgi:phage host-nuclease inhibitor protein Gam
MVRSPKKFEIVEPETLSAADALAGQISRVMLTADKLKNDQEKEISAIRDRYAERLLDLNNYVDEAVILLKHWADKNSSLFAVKKSIDLTHAVIGFRTGMPRLKLKAKLTWDKALEAIKKVSGAVYVRIEEVLDKAALLSDRDKPATKLLMDNVGIKVVQDETFFIEPRREEIVEPITEAKR